MRLHQKLLLTMLLPALLLGLVGVVGVSSLLQLEQAAGRILSHNYASIQQCRVMEEALRSLLVAEQAEARQASERFAVALALCEENVTEAAEPAVLTRLRARWAPLREAVLAGERPTEPHLREASESLAELVAINEAAMFADEHETTRAAGAMVAATLAAALLALLALGAYAWLSAKRISHPVVEVAERLHRALNPDASAGAAAGGDEIELLRAELDALLERLRGYEAQTTQERISLEDRLALVMGEVNEGLLLLDAEARALALNPVAEQLLGAQPGQALQELLPQAEELRRCLDSILRGEDTGLGELRAAIGDEERIYLPKVTRLHEGGERLVLFWDVTEERRFEESRRRFISMLSHQLKTPLTSLRMSVELLQERSGQLPAAAAELLEIARQDCRNLARLVSDLIDAAQDVAPELVLNLRSVGLAGLLVSALRPLRKQAEDQQVELALPPTTPELRVRVDPVKFPWVVTNITGNALRYTPAGGRISVRLSAEVDAVWIEVRDSGAGIAAADLESIFLPRVSLASQPEPGTHGLGLAIAREIVEAHRGTITAESELGEGTTFRIRLPRDPGVSG